MIDSFLFKKILAEYNVSVTQSILLRVFTDIIFLPVNLVEKNIGNPQTGSGSSGLTSDSQKI